MFMQRLNDRERRRRLKASYGSGKQENIPELVS